jgi:hypothetical protein
MPLTPEEASQLSSYDPTATRPGSAGPEPAQEPQEDGLVVPFDRRYTEPFVGLIYLGALTKTFEYLGHAFVIRTLTQDEQLMVAPIIAAYRNSIAEQAAYTTAIAGMCVESVDGKQLPMPLGDDVSGTAWGVARFNHVKQWFPFVIDKIYNEFLDLERLVKEVVEAMGKASGSEESTPGLSAISA